MKKVAYLFMIYDVINHEEIWHEFFKNIDKNRYNIYIHYKVNKYLNYFNKYKLNDCIDTEWGRISLVKAQNLLIDEALKDRKNEHFIFLSNSCVPFKSFDFIYDNLDKNYSYFSLFREDDIFPRYVKITQYTDYTNIKKTSQWCILNKKHAIIMVSKDDYLDWYKDVLVPDESCYITNIFVNYLQNEIITNCNYSDSTTFVNWGETSNNGWSPKVYSSISEKEIIHLLKSRCFFARKFSEKCYDLLYNKIYLTAIACNSEYLT